MSEVQNRPLRRCKPGASLAHCVARWPRNANVVGSIPVRDCFISFSFFRTFPLKICDLFSKNISYTYFTLLRTQKIHTSAYNTLTFTVSFRVSNRVRVSFQRYFGPVIELYAAGGRNDFPRWSAHNCLCDTLRS